MQAMILAAGMGKRLGHLTRDNTKCMVPVHNRTLIERILSQLEKFNLSQIILVVGYKAENVKRFIGNSINDTPIKYVENPIYDKTNNIYSLYLAKEFLLNEDTLLLESDLIIEEKILCRLLEHPYPNLAVVAKYQNWMDGTVVTLDEDDNIERFIPKKNFSFKELDSYYKTVNIYKFSRAFSQTHYVPFLEAYSKALGNNEYYEQVLRVITMLDKPEIKALRLNGEKWYEIDDIQDLNNAETIFSEPADKLSDYEKRRGGYWRFPELVDFSNLNNPFFPTATIKDEIKANFDILQSSPPSQSATTCLLAAKIFSINQDHVIIGNGVFELMRSFLNLDPFKTGVVIPNFRDHIKYIPKESLVCFAAKSPDFSYTADDLIEFFSRNKVEQLVLANPDNGSGNCLSSADLSVLLNWTKAKGIRLLVDETFIDVAASGLSGTLMRNDVLEENSHLLVLKSMSVAYGIPGFPLSVAASSDTNLMQRIKAQSLYGSINSFSEFFMQILGKYEKNYLAACNLFQEERVRVYGQLKKIDCLRVIPSNSAFFLCEVRGRLTAPKLTRLLLDKHNVLITDCSGQPGFGQKDYVQIAVRNKGENNELLHALKSVVETKVLNLVNTKL